MGNYYGQRDIPALDGAITYVVSMRRLILQAAFRKIKDATMIRLFFLSGVEYSKISIQPTDLISDVLARLRRDLGAHCQIEVLMPNGEILSMVNSATFAPFFE